MKVLYVTTLALEYNSPATIRNIALINGFISLGCEVDTLSVEPDPRSSVFDASLALDGVRHDYRVPVSEPYRAFTSKSHSKAVSLTALKRHLVNALRRLYLRVETYDGLKVSVKNLHKVPIRYDHYDVVISSSDPRSSHLLAEEFMKLYPGCAERWIQYWGDPMYADITRQHLMPGVLKSEEARLLSSADRIVYVSPLTEEANRRLYPSNGDKMVSIPPAYIKENWSSSRNSNPIPVVGYFGSYRSDTRNILPLYNASVSGLFHLEIVGGGDIILGARPNVSISKRVSLSEARCKEAESDVLVCICNLKGTQIPSKVYYYASSDKPILVILDGESEAIRRYLEPYDRYVFCENTSESILKAITEISAGIKKAEFRPVKEFSSENVARKFLHLLE